VKIRWTPEAENDRLNIMTYIAGDDPLAALRMDELFGESVRALINFPEMGRDGIVPGTHELFPHKAYRIVYQIDGEAIWVLAVVHTSRLWPNE